MKNEKKKGIRDHLQLTDAQFLQLRLLLQKKYKIRLLTEKYKIRINALFNDRDYSQFVTLIFVIYRHLTILN